MLQTTKDRRPLTHRGWHAAIMAAQSLSLPLAAAGLAPAIAVTPVPQDEQSPAAAVTIAEPSAAHAAAPDAAVSPAPAPTPAPAHPSAVAPRTGTIAGQVVDQTGGTMPGTTMTLTVQHTGQTLTAISDAAGRFAFRDLPAGEYSLTGVKGGARVPTAIMRPRREATSASPILEPPALARYPGSRTSKGATARETRQRCAGVPCQATAAWPPPVWAARHTGRA